MKAARVFALLIVIMGVALAFLHRHAIDPGAIRAAIAANPLAPVTFIALQLVASLLFVPRTVMGIAAGLVFGLFWGTLWALCGAMAGAAAAFALTRWFGLSELLDRSPGVGALARRAEQGGWRAVAILRLTPVPHSVANTLLAMTAVSWRDYLAGSFVGMLPMTVAQVGVGASGKVILEGRQWLFACLLLAFALGATFLLKRVGRGSQAPAGAID
ncbi:MAG TPA: VTT domain-containing protein [Rhizomicrobium sp.]|nr:VTT domain-containing protein [Rhizomicrobium sp.]